MNDPLVPSFRVLLDSDLSYYRQTLRWLMHDRGTVSPAVVETLARGLQSGDWEVRATALLAVGRLKVSELGPAIRRVDAYPARKQGLDRRDFDLLKVLPKVVATLLADVPIPELLPLPLSDPQAMRVHIWRCAAGLAVEHHDRVFLLLHALTTPLPLFAPPASLPPAVVQTEQGYQLASTRLALAWVPPLPHWLGGEALLSSLDNPIRNVTPTQGFFVATRLLAGGKPARFDAALHLCDQMAQAEGAALRLAQADEWEMAARGADGRRYPTGNSVEIGMDTRPSPYGLLDLLAPQWATRADRPVVCGSATAGCAARHAAAPDAQLGVRLVLG